MTYHGQQDHSKRVNMRGISLVFAVVLLAMIGHVSGGCTNWSGWSNCSGGSQTRVRSCTGLSVGSVRYTRAVRGCGMSTGCGACPGSPGMCHRNGNNCICTSCPGNCRKYRCINGQWTCLWACIGDEILPVPVKK